MHRPSAALLGLLICARAAAAEAAGPLRESFELVVPAAPTAVSIGGRPTLVYELHLTNFTRDALALTALEVLAGGPGAPRRLAEYRGAELEALLGRPGAPKVPNRARIGPGLRAVVYLWLPFENADAVPSELRHRVEYSGPGAHAPTSSVDGALVAVRPEAPIVLGPPLSGGPWVAIYDPAAERGHRRVLYTVDGRARIPGRFAIDWIAVDGEGRFAHGDPARVASWVGYGADVLAVSDAVVVDVRDGIEESATLTDPGGGLDGSGNYVVLDVGHGCAAFYEHLQPGSVRVRAGERVRRGQVLGRLGYTGHSTGPHLHFHVAEGRASLTGEGAPYVIDALEVLGAYASMQGFGSVRWTPNSGGAAEHRLELPAAGAVVRFANAHQP